MYIQTFFEKQKKIPEINFAKLIRFTFVPGNLVRHYESIHEGKRYHCEHCGKNFTQQSQLKSHKESAHQGIRYHCNFCSRVFTIKGELNRHKKRVHETEEAVDSIKSEEYQDDEDDPDFYPFGR